jgi:transposase
MQAAADSLPNDPVQLQGIIQQLRDQLAESEQQRSHQRAQLEQQAATLTERSQRIEQLLDSIELLRRKRFGPSADRLPDNQLALFDETELEALIGELEEELEHESKPTPSTDDQPAKPKRKPVRRPLPRHLPRVERIRDLPEAIKAAMGEDWRFIGHEVSE